jgi:GDP-L-fucose synthase
VWGSGNQARDFIYIEEVISGILETCEKIDDASALNLGSGISTSFSELVSKAGEVLGKDCTVRPLTDKPEGVYARYCDRSKRERFGIRLRTPLKDGIRIVAEYLKNAGRE